MNRCCFWICYDARMRTTLTIDDGIARALEDLAHRSNKPFKQVVNETLRAGLSAPAASKSKPYRIKPAALGGVSPGINLDKPWHLPMPSRTRSSRPRCSCASDSGRRQSADLPDRLRFSAARQGASVAGAVLSDPAPVGLPWIVILAFVRITTRAGIMRRPLSPAEALDYVDSWLQQPCVEIIAPGEQHWPILRRLLEITGTAGNLTSDAHIATLALERGASVCSTDHDFTRFPGIRHVNPLATG
jgi:toxin-antitoxin system PIN domain toxin